MFDDQTKKYDTRPRAFIFAQFVSCTRRALEKNFPLQVFSVYLVHQFRMGIYTLGILLSSFWIPRTLWKSWLHGIEHCSLPTSYDLVGMPAFSGASNQGFMSIDFDKYRAFKCHVDGGVAMLSGGPCVVGRGYWELGREKDRA